MTLDEIWKTYDGYTKSASDAARPLGFAGIAVIWLFKVEERGLVHLDSHLLVAGAFFIAGLALDLLQFIVGAFIFLLLGNRREKLVGAARNADYSSVAIAPIDICFVLKLAAIFTGYAILLEYFLSRLS